MCYGARLPAGLWPEIDRAAVYLLNRTSRYEMDCDPPNERFQYTQRTNQTLLSRISDLGKAHLKSLRMQSICFNHCIFEEGDKLTAIQPEGLGWSSRGIRLNECLSNLESYDIQYLCRTGFQYLFFFFSYYFFFFFFFFFFGCIQLGNINCARRTPARHSSTSCRTWALCSPFMIQILTFAQRSSVSFLMIRMQPPKGLFVPASLSKREGR